MRRDWGFYVLIGDMRGAELEYWTNQTSLAGARDVETWLAVGAAANASYSEPGFSVVRDMLLGCGVTS